MIFSLTHKGALLFVWGGCPIYLWRLHDFFVERLHDFLKSAFLCVVRLCDFLCGEVAYVFVRIGCVIFLGEEVALFFSLTHSRGCVIFLWNGCVILRLHDFCCGELV